MVDGSSGDTLDPAVRLGALVDAGTFTPLHDVDAVRVSAARGRIGGEKMVAFCTDATRRGGALGAEECRRIADTIDLAVAEGCAVVGLWHSGGANLGEGVGSLDGMGRVFAATVRASGRVPQIAVVLGPAAGGAAYGPALADLVVMSPRARIFVTGPDVVRTVTGEAVDMAELGGPAAHGRRSGVAHVVADSESDALRRARSLVRVLSQPTRCDPSAVGPAVDLAALLPRSPRQVYDVRQLVRALLDPPAGPDEEFHELQAGWAPNMVVGFGRLAGGAVGIVATNPLRKGGCLDAVSAEKASRFVRMCNAFAVPLVSIVDVPGYLPGVQQEWDGVVRRGAKLLFAFAECTVPRVTVVTRRAVGGAYIAMNSRSLGADLVLAWPGAEVSVMSAEAAVGILHRNAVAAAPESERDEVRTRLAEEYRTAVGGITNAVEIGVVDEVIDPSTTRERIANALASAVFAPAGEHGNIPL